MRKKVLHVIHRFILWYALVAGILLPFYFGLQQQCALFRNHTVVVVMNILALFMMIGVFYFLLALLLNPAFRGIFVSRLAGIRERDEREEYVTGRALRTTFLLTISMQIVVILLAFMQISITPTPDGHHNLIMGMGLVTKSHFDVLQRSVQPGCPSVLPAHYAGLFIILLAGQLILFRIFSRKYYKM